MINCLSSPASRSAQGHIQVSVVLRTQVARRRRRPQRRAAPLYPNRQPSLSDTLYIVTKL